MDAAEEGVPETAAPRPIARGCWCAGALIALAAALAYLTPFRLIVTWFGDEGHVAVGAERILAGEVPYRDFFELITPGSLYLYAATFRVFGTSVETLRFFTAVVGAAAASLLYGLGASQGLRWRAWLPVFLFVAAFPAWFVASHHWVSTLLVAGALALLLPARAGRALPPWRWAAAGAMSALTLLTLQDKGIYLAVLLGATAAWEGKRSAQEDPATHRFSTPWRPTRPLVAFCAGLLAVLGPAMVCLALWRALYAFFYDCFLWNVRHYHGFSGSGYFPDARVYWAQIVAARGGAGVLRPLFLLAYFGSLAVLPLVALGTGLLALRRAGRGPWDQRRPLAVLLAGGAAGFLSALHYPENVHFATTAGPLWVLLFVAADRLAAPVP
ncbi:MAG: hypothetical protein QHJ73_07130, partial [Armatimonadota bacterium]|nr:hypothetical protein [Armatimonadota bacterium]